MEIRCKRGTVIGTLLIALATSISPSRGFFWMPGQVSAATGTVTSVAHPGVILQTVPHGAALGLAQLPQILCSYARVGKWPTYPRYLQAAILDLGRHVYALDDQGVQQYCNGHGRITVVHRPCCSYSVYPIYIKPSTNVTAGGTGTRPPTPGTVPTSVDTDVITGITDDPEASETDDAEQTDPGEADETDVPEEDDEADEAAEAERLMAITVASRPTATRAVGGSSNFGFVPLKPSQGQHQRTTAPPGTLKFTAWRRNRTSTERPKRRPTKPMATDKRRKSNSTAPGRGNGTAGQQQW